jgi:Fur family peroxide stress response transcriptional regulator
MPAEAKDIARRVEAFVDSCKAQGIRVTHQRIEVFREAIRTVSHPDAESIHRNVKKKIRTVTLDTVYRTLRFLVEQGFVATMGIHHDRLRFDGNVSPHHHLVCLKCGSVTDFAVEGLEKISPPKRLAVWGRISTTHVEMRGLCAACLRG